MTLALTDRHAAYAMALRSKKINKTLAIGSAGTGKTYMACEAAIEFAGVSGRKIVLLRPPVSFTQDAAPVPGNEQEKLDPWKRPIKQNLFKLGVSYDTQKSWEEKGKLIYHALEYVQGMTFDNSFIIVDECENLSIKQIRTITTRMGKYSKMVFCGDIKQTSEYFHISGLAEYCAMLEWCNSPYWNILNFDSNDVLRSEECKQEIIMHEAWDEYQYKLQLERRAEQFDKQRFIKEEEVLNETLLLQV